MKYTLNEMAELLAVAKYKVSEILEKLSIYPKSENKKKEHLYTSEDFEKVENYNITSHKIIYLPIQSEVIHSKSNNWSEKKINKAMVEYE